MAKKQRNMQKITTKQADDRNLSPTPSHQQLQAAAIIDNWITGIFLRGGDWDDVIAEMRDYLPTFRIILASANQQQIDALRHKYPGFNQFGSLVSHIIQDEWL